MDEQLEEVDESLRDINGDCFQNGFVSGWDDDDESVLEEGDPHETPEKEFLWAAEYGQENLICDLLESNKDIIKATDMDGYTALHRACYNNEVKVAKILLDSGADIFARTKDNWTPFHSSCHWNSADCTALLLSCGMDVNDRTNGGITGLHLAAMNSRAKETLQLLLLHPKIDINIKNEGGECPYQIAIRKGLHGKLFEIAEACFNYI